MAKTPEGKFKKEEDKKKVKNNKNNRGYSVGLILIVLFVFWAFGVFDTSNEDKIYAYSSCVDWCVSDINDCVFFDVVYDGQRTAWVQWDNYDICSLELESCVSDCELDYGK